MDYTQQYNKLIEDFNLGHLDDEKREETLRGIAQQIQTQFLIDIHELLGDDTFDALEKSVDMGEAFYATTLKHVLPSYEEVFMRSRQKVLEQWKAQ